jgi:restriction endonuclease Mrr
MLVLVVSLALPVFAQRRGRRRAVIHDRHVQTIDQSQLEQTAKTNGYKSGKADGINDRQHGESYNFRDERAYQKATEGYSPTLGSKSHYQEVYRVSFENGYRDGWNGY